MSLDKGPAKESLHSDEPYPLQENSKTYMASPEHKNELQGILGLSPFDSPETTAFKENALKPKFPRTYVIRDPQQMVWVISGNSLIAVPDKSNVKPVVLSIIACRDTEFYDEEKGNLVYLGIQGEDLCLFCTEVENKPTLQLEVINIMDLYKENEAQMPFLFIHSMDGITSIFQSVSYPDWFIATSTIASQPVILTQKKGETYNINFFLDPVY